MHIAQYVLIALLVALTLWGVAFSLVAPLAPNRGELAPLFIPCLPAQNVVASGKATINFANLLGYTVEYILLELGGGAFTKSMITDVTVKANAKVIVNDTGSNMDSRMQYRGETADASYLVIAFDESRARSELVNQQVVDGKKIGCIDTTFGIAQLTGEITIAGATTPSLNAYAEVSAAPQADPRFRGLISKVFNFTVSPAASGTFLFDVPQGKKKGCIVKRIFLVGSTVTGYEVKKNGITIMKAGTAALNTYIQKREGETPQANIQAIDFIKSRNESGALNASDANTMEYYMTVSGAGNVTVIVEAYDLLDNN